MRLLLLVGCLVTSGCYSGSRAAQDINVMWRGHARGELEARIGVPAAVVAQPDGTSLLRWMGKGSHITLPSGRLDVRVTPTSFDLDAEARAGSVERYEYEMASAVIDPAGAVVRLDSSFLVAGIPAGTNVRTGAIFGFHAGAGIVADATSPMPSLGVYLGGMIGPRLALLGAYSFVNGKGDAGYAMGHAWAFAVQHWPMARLAVRAGPALVIDLEPGLTDPALSPGGVGAVSYALVRAGSFVLDARLDATVSTGVAFGTFGIGVNVN